MDSKCNSCGAAIIWVVTENGKAIPLDAQQSMSGNIRLEHLGAGEGSPLLKVRAIIGGPSSGPWMAHFATCPNAKRHRKSKNATHEERR